MKWQLFLFFHLPDLLIVLLVMTEGFLMSSQLFRFCLSLRIKGQMFLVCEILKIEPGTLKTKSLIIASAWKRGFLFLWLCHLRQFITCPISRLLTRSSLSADKTTWKEMSRGCVTQLLLSHRRCDDNLESVWSELTVTLIGKENPNKEIMIAPFFTPSSELPHVSTMHLLLKTGPYLP